MKLSIAKYRDLSWLYTTSIKLKDIREKGISITYFINNRLASLEPVNCLSMKGPVTCARQHSHTVHLMVGRILAVRLHHPYPAQSGTAAQWWGACSITLALRKLAQSGRIAAHACLTDPTLESFFRSVNMVIGFTVAWFFARLAGQFKGGATKAQVSGHGATGRDMGRDMRTSRNAACIVVVHFIQRHVWHAGRHACTDRLVTPANIPH